MSGQYFEIHVAPVDETASKALSDLESRLAAEDEFDGAVDSVSVSRESPTYVVIHIDGATTIDPDSLLDAIRGIGVSRIEAQVFNSQVGEYGFFEDDEYYAVYSEGAWRWLEDPEGDDAEEKFDPSTLSSPFREVAELWLRDPVAAIQSVSLDSIAEQAFADLIENISMKRDIYQGSRTGFVLSATEEVKGYPFFACGVAWEEAKAPDLDREVLAQHMSTLDVSVYRDEEEEVTWVWKSGSLDASIRYENRRRRGGLLSGVCALNLQGFPK